MHSAINKKSFKRLASSNDELHKVELVKPRLNKNSRSMWVLFQFATCWKENVEALLQLFFTKYCARDKHQEMYLDTDSRYLALAEKDLDKFIPEKNQNWVMLQGKNCDDTFTWDACGFFPRKYSAKHKKKHDKREIGLLKEEFYWSEILVLCGKT